MRQLDFLKFIPGGNPTILITTPVEAGQRMKLANALMDPLHLQAEQVGYVDLQAAPPSLEMMGGEFCLNATRCLVFEMARQGLFLPLAGTEDLYGLVRSSGAETLLPVRVKNGKARIYPERCAATAETGTMPRQPDSPPGIQPGEDKRVTSLECMVSLRVDASSANLHEVEPGVVLVRLPGISHLLLDESTHSMPEEKPGIGREGAIFALAARWLKKLGLKSEPACGVIWCRELKTPSALMAEPGKTVLFRQITPVVHVAETGSCILESACGSATLALGVFEAARLSRAEPQVFAGFRGQGELFLNVRQPSGQNLRQKVAYSPHWQEKSLEPANGGIGAPTGDATGAPILRCEAEVGGVVRLCAGGVTFV